LQTSLLVEHIENKLKFLDSITAKEIMVPRIDCVSIPVDANLIDVIATINEKGHSRIPVWEKTLDNIIGILYAKDLLKFIREENQPTIKELLRPAYFIPETKMIISLLAEFKKKHVHLACVVDEYGGFSGIVTMEDILEEIVGDIQDEYDKEEEDIIQLSDNVFIVDARLSIIDFNDRFGFNIPNDEFDTIGGFLFELFGKVPSIKEKIQYKEKIEFEVTNITGNKIKNVKLTKIFNEHHLNK
jgi:CBS domain containing-hemolysin-like protein